MAFQYWIPRCQCCGEVGNRVSMTSPNEPVPPPPYKPNIQGKCESNLNGKHAPKWEKA